MTPKPKISPEDWREWREAFKESESASAEERQRADFGRSILLILFPSAPTVDKFEAFCAGEWLWRELGASGLPDADDELRTQIVFAAGQKIAADVDADVWGVALRVLEEWKRGRWDKPGIALADRLFQIQMAELTKRYGPPTASATKIAARMIARQGRPNLPDEPLSEQEKYRDV